MRARPKPGDVASLEDARDAIWAYSTGKTCAFLGVHALRIGGLTTYARMYASPGALVAYCRRSQLSAAARMLEQNAGLYPWTLVVIIPLSRDHLKELIAAYRLEGATV